MASKRLGRGHGSGKGGHTVGRGQKGQKARGKIHVLFQGLKVKKSTLKKLPLLRGRGKFAPKAKPVEISINKFKDIKKGTVVNQKLLVEMGLLTEEQYRKFGVKILGKAAFKNDLKFEVPVSK